MCSPSEVWDILKERWKWFVSLTFFVTSIVGLNNAVTLKEGTLFGLANVSANTAYLIWTGIGVVFAYFLLYYTDEWANE